MAIGTGVDVSERRFRLDPSYRRPRRGRSVIGGSPLRLFTLGAAGVRVMAAIESGDDLPAGHDRLTDRLIDTGALHPVLGPPPLDAATSLTVVVPAHDALPLFRPVSCRTIVIDDASSRPLAAPTGTDVEVVRLPVNVGPGAARNAGLELVDTAFVAFVDTDVMIDERALLDLLGHFDDPRVALVAPRIRPLDGPGPLVEFERWHSPLDRGAEPGRIAAATRVSFVPAAVVVCRTAALRAIGGFDPALRVGEDVDLVWRLDESGYRCRYEPTISAQHRVRPALRSWLRQRVAYGSSSAPLARRHPGALAPLRMSGWSAGVWAAVGAGFPVTGGAIGIGTAVALARKLQAIPKSESFRLAVTGHAHAGRLVASTITRVWWPVAALLALVSRRARRALVAALVVPATIDWLTQRPALHPARYVALRALDDMAYGVGVWSGAIRERSAEVLLPSFESWPPRDAAT
ncbi:MAG: mycofactocin biosynthesis glycosyltransferase MftF [Actinobacteria bacterium]|nr:mycofactocin biosynthesis glycosyltransferase MftF [Actinomycetota bacterium]